MLGAGLPADRRVHFLAGESARTSKAADLKSRRALQTKQHSTPLGLTSTRGTIRLP